MVTNCEFCAFYVYDDDGYAECDVNLDEDEMARFLGSSYQSCPYSIQISNTNAKKYKLRADKIKAPPFT